MIEKIREIVKKEASDIDWKCHILPVVKYAKHLAKVENANEEVVELAALLHDIGRIKFSPKNHDVTGMEEAKKILKELNYPEKTIEQVAHCIKAHRARDYPAETKEAQIIRDADASAHFDTIPILVQVGLRKYNGDIQKAVEWLDAKVDRNWNDKIKLPETKKLVEKKYNAAKLLIESTKKSFSNS